MSSRENILGRLKSVSFRADASLPEIPCPELLYNFVPTEKTEMLNSFRERLLFLKGEFFEASSLEDASKTLETLVSQYTSGVTCTSPLINELLNYIPSPNKYNPINTYKNLHSGDFGLTTCDALCARTGSVLLSSDAAGGRRLSVLPPHHIVVARTNQLQSSFLPWLSSLSSSSISNYSVIITGPSRTSDIEKILVLGAHGPKRLTVILIDS